jgi:hypothetical protein
MAATWFDTFDDYAISAEEFTDAGDHVVGRIEQAGRAEGQSGPGHGDPVVGVRRAPRLIITLDAGATRDQAPKAVGLP